MTTGIAQPRSCGIQPAARPLWRGPAHPALRRRAAVRPNMDAVGVRQALWIGTVYSTWRASTSSTSSSNALGKRKDFLHIEQRIIGSPSFLFRQNPLCKKPGRRFLRSGHVAGWSSISTWGLCSPAARLTAMYRFSHAFPPDSTCRIQPPAVFFFSRSLPRLVSSTASSRDASPPHAGWQPPQCFRRRNWNGDAHHIFDNVAAAHTRGNGHAASTSRVLAAA